MRRSLSFRRLNPPGGGGCAVITRTDSITNGMPYKNPMRRSARLPASGAIAPRPPMRSSSCVSTCRTSASPAPRNAPSEKPRNRPPGPPRHATAHVRGPRCGPRRPGNGAPDGLLPWQHFPVNVIMCELLHKCLYAASIRSGGQFRIGTSRSLKASRDWSYHAQDIDCSDDAFCL
jgi:hypothetical protein